MPKVTEVSPEQELAVDVQLASPVRPLVRARVVYLGPRRNRSLSLKGRVMEESLGEGEERQVKHTVTDTGFTPYDFSTVDLMGRPIKARRMPAGHPDPDVRDRPWCIVEHPDHLWIFARMKERGEGPEFKILATADQRALIDEYFARKARSLKATDRDYADISKAG